MKMTTGGFDILRKKFGSLKQSQVDAINHIVQAINDDGTISYPQAAYVLATVHKETGGKMLPVAEIGKGKNKTYGTWYKNSKGELYCFKDSSKHQAYMFSNYPFLYYGRGIVQVTWYSNYEKLSKVFGVDLLSNPDLLLQEEYSTKAALYGMKTGLFTGKKLDDYINASQKDYVNARKIINGTDCAVEIAGYAEVYKSALRSY